MKKKISIKGGKVHNVGYRLHLMNLADDVGIENFDAKNIKEAGVEAVRVLVESSEDNILEFFDIAKKGFPPHAVVESVDVDEYDRRVKPLESFRSAFNSAQLSKIANVGVTMLGKQDQMLGKQDQMLGKQDQMLGKQDQMLGKQDQTINTLQDIKANTSQIPDIKANTSEMKKLLAKGTPKIIIIEREQVKMKKDIANIKKALAMA
ncbi:hypothetical protein BEH94_09365 [Candidatus Altiarchaeales archaeon WOR_SM1_SCG]|nr:hypothetical protein BEH94_09365 [Candidatus Altiarchaeales archaeon WOR_SM1_SCG]